MSGVISSSQEFKETSYLEVEDNNIIICQGQVIASTLSIGIWMALVPVPVT